MTTTLPRSLKSIPGFPQLWQRLEAMPMPEPEDSIPLRVLVQAMVTVGIIAVDIAAADVADSLGVSLWAVPVSMVGASWSYFSRRKRNVPVKFCIAIAMLIGLGLFFVRLVAERNDTRLALAELLIQLQVFHSFDMPRRKDLGYSIVIGLILMGVAATLSQTFWFAPMLLAFLALALPVLILDYRSRLGLAAPRLRQVGADLSPRRLGVILLVILALGLTIFAFLPRLPGYQLRSFPVSAPIEFDGQFDGDNILNPGYMRQGRGTAEGGTFSEEGSIEGGTGQVDSNQYYGFNSRINQNLRGTMQPKVVMRVRSQAEGFWRVMAFDRYTGQGWEVTRNSKDEISRVDRGRWSMRFDLPQWVTKTRRREVIQSYTITADLPNLIPALADPKELYFPTRQVAFDQEGALRSPVPLSEGLTYTVVSQVPYRDRTQLGQASTNYPKGTREYYLQMPENGADRIRKKTEEMLAKSRNPLPNPYEKALFLAQYLKQNYRIQPEMPFLEQAEDLVQAFLFTYEGGYPDHFSTALTVMLRSIGIPARLVVGYRPGEFNPFTGFYVVKNTDAFAMTEVFFPRFGWFAFNPIPGMELLPPSIQEFQAFSVLKQFWNWIAGWLPSPVTGFLNGLVEWLSDVLGGAIAFLTSLMNRGWVGVLVTTVGLTALGFLGWLLWQGWQLWRYHRWLSTLPPIEALYQQMLRWLAEQGFPKKKAQTPLEYGRETASHSSPEQAALITDISQTYVRWRYGGQPGDWAVLRRRLQQIQTKSWRR